ncbi:MAG TPA: N-acetylmuramoyl-L-alanine amidase [Terrimicrobiaceae bacterium]
MPQILVRNRLKPTEKLRGATVTITGTTPGAATVSGATNAHGVVTLGTTSLADGAYILTAAPVSTLAGAVGPTTASAPVPGDRIFRTLSVDLTIASGAITAVAVPAPNRPDGDASLGARGAVTVGLQPVWMRSPNHTARGSNQITMIIVHHTGGPVVGPAINTFLSTGEGTSAHYVINTDGQIIKMVQDGRRAHHAGEARWAGASDINSISIGIEIVNATGAYPAAQYTALLDLIAALRTAHPTIVDWNIIGHSDVATTHGKLGRKSSDPGLQFEWSRLEARNLGMLMVLGPFPTTIYASFFATFAGDSLRRGDNDTKRIFGGTKRAGTFVGNPVRELQDDLTTIGYHLGRPDGEFGDKTRAAVQMFQEHFFAGGRGHKAPDGRVDLRTAELIKSVTGAHP